MALRPVAGAAYYWKDGMKLGYQDAGSWTLMKSTPDDRAKAAWLYAQFVTSKTVDVKKSHVGLTFIRESTIRDKSFTERAPKLGGLVEFLSLACPRAVVADRHQRAGLSEARTALVAGDRRCILRCAKTAQEAMDSLCAEQEKVTAAPGTRRRSGRCRPEARRRAGSRVLEYQCFGRRRATSHRS